MKLLREVNETKEFFRVQHRTDPAQHAARRHASQIAHFIYYSLNTHDVTVKRALEEMLGARGEGRKKWARNCVLVCLASDLIKQHFFAAILASSIDIL
jgi:hypothetical protein